MEGRVELARMLLARDMLRHQVGRSGLEAVRGSVRIHADRTVAQGGSTKEQWMVCTFCWLQLMAFVGRNIASVE